MSHYERVFESVFEIVGNMSISFCGGFGNV